MLAKRIIPCLDVTDGRVVKGVNFVELIDAGDPVECAIAYNLQQADELVFLNRGASRKQFPISLAAKSDVSPANSPKSFGWHFGQNYDAN